MSLNDWKATKMEENKLVKRKYKSRSLGRNIDDALMGDSFLCVFGDHGVRPLGLGEKTTNPVGSFFTSQEYASE